MATVPQSDNSCNGTPDWTAGYGFQFWINAEDGYRGDGAFGQLCMVYPKKNTVIAVQAVVAEMQKEVDALNRLCVNMHGEDNMTEEQLSAKLDEFNEVCGYTEPKDNKIFDKVYYCAENDMGITKISFENREKCVSAIISNGEELQEIRLGKNRFEDSCVRLPWFKPMLNDIMLPKKNERVSMSCCAAFEGNRLSAKVRYRDNPMVQTLVFEFEGSGIKMYKYTNEEEKKVLLTGSTEKN